MTDEAAFLRSVIELPGDDGPRLTYADFLDERGEAEQAEFIRVQCELARFGETILCPGPPGCAVNTLGQVFHGPKCRHEILRRRERELLDDWSCQRWFDFLPGWAVARKGDGGIYWTKLPDFGERIDGSLRGGFVAAVTLPLAALLGGPCAACAEQGRPGQYRYRTETALGWRDCPACRGTGRREGCAAELFRVAPIEQVRLMDRELQSSHNVAWWCVDPNWYQHPPGPNRHWLPVELGPYLEADKNCTSIDELTNPPRPGIKVFNFFSLDRNPAEVARAALSTALVAHGRDLAGLPPLPSPWRIGPGSDRFGSS